MCMFAIKMLVVQLLNHNNVDENPYEGRASLVTDSS